MELTSKKLQVLLLIDMGSRNYEADRSEGCAHTI
jgi:hypothetical protein